MSCKFELLEFVLVDITWGAGRLTESCALVKLYTEVDQHQRGVIYEVTFRNVFTTISLVREYATNLLAINKFYVKLYSVVDH